jgi:hypothetical protein
MGMSGAQRSVRGSAGVALRDSTTKEISQTAMPTPMKIKRASSAVLIDRLHALMLIA